MRTFACAFAALLALAATPAAAVTLNLGDTLLPGTDIFARPELDGAVIADRYVDYDLTFDGRRLTGRIQQSVIRETVAGTLDFTWRVLPDGGDLAVIGLRLGGFGDFITDGDWRADSLGDVAPTLARKFDGGFVNFIFDAAVGPAQSSHIMFLKTRAWRFDDSGFFDVVCDGGGVGCISPQGGAFAPAAAPEPATWALLILGFGLAGVALRRRSPIVARTC